MDRGRYQVLLASPHLRRHRHERVSLLDLEELCHAFFQYGRGKGAKRSALLDARVQPISHSNVARVSQDRAMTQRPRDEFRAPLEPAHDFPRAKIVGDLPYELVPRQPLMRHVGGAQSLRDFRFAIANTMEGVRELKFARPSKRMMVVPQSAAQWGA